MNRTSLAFCIALSLFALAGCGGGGGGGSTPDPSPSVAVSPSPIASPSPLPSPSPSPLPTGVGVYRGQALPSANIQNFQPWRFLPDGTIYGWKTLGLSSGDPGIVRNLGTDFEKFNNVLENGVPFNPGMNTPPQLGFVAAENGDAYIAYHSQFTVLYSAATRKTTVIKQASFGDQVIFAINNQDELFGSSSVNYKKFTRNSDGIWTSTPLWSDRKFHLGTSDKDFLAAEAQNGTFAGWVGDSSNDSIRQPAYVRDGNVVVLPSPFPGKTAQATTVLPNGDIVGTSQDADGNAHMIVWHGGDFKDYGAQTIFRLYLPDSSLVGGKFGSGNVIFKGNEVIPMRFIGSDGNPVTVKTFVSALADGRLIVNTEAFSEAGNYILTPTF